MPELNLEITTIADFIRLEGSTFKLNLAGSLQVSFIHPK